MRVALYCRVSTDEQTTANQKRDLLRYCESRKWDVAQVFEDVGISGAKHDRPALNDLMKQARQHRFDTVLVWHFDRFARSTQHLLQALQEFQSLGIDFISYGEGIDTSTPMGKMIFTFLGAIAEFERSLIQERVRSGIRRAQAAGIHCGRGKTTFDIEKALQMKRGGFSWEEIHLELNVSNSTLRHYLTPLLKSPQK